MPSDVITDVIGIWSVFFKSYVCLNFVTMRVGRLTSGDLSLIWNLGLLAYDERISK